MIRHVAPFVGAWIEIQSSLRRLTRTSVAPFVGAWIEIAKAMQGGRACAGRSLCGSVD